MPLLMTLVPNTVGTILELGCGVFSTPFLHWACYEQQRRLISYESSAAWARMLENFNRAKYHTLEHVQDWDSVDLSGPYGLALVDHSPSERRWIEVLRLADTAGIILAHDGSDHQRHHYGYDKIDNKAFRHQYLYVRTFPYTLVFSNVVNPRNLLNPKWLKRYRAGKSDWYRDESRAPLRRSTQTSEERRALIVSTRKRLEAEPFAQTGVSAIKWELSKLGADFHSDSTINRILHKEGLVKKNLVCA